ncbi:MAG: sigma-70 family RNA polymerase sigma factor [Candidatus Hinthialibacter antarcticus]|nr:sigma-70 family RNA polymerase sigma factor [Candidatus Hinthialibacter antarcticus]
MNETTTLSPQNWAEDYGDVLYRYALRMLKNPDQAEDAVQETFIAAIRAKDSFKGKSTVRTWLIGILRNKIHDMLRKKYREQEILDPSSDLENTYPIRQWFDYFNHWKNHPATWKNPSASLNEKEFWLTLNQCIENLPEPMADAFSLRVFDETNSEEICKMMDITTTHLGVLIHRARLRLRQCLEINWFKK